MKRRLAIIAGSALSVAVAGAGVYAVRQHQINAKTLAYRAEGMDAFQHGDYAKALIPLSKYNERKQSDVETLLAFGKARSRVEAPNNRHLVEAIQYFRKALELDPSNSSARHELLDLYSTTGYTGEAIALADELLKKDAKDVAALRAKAMGLTARRQLAEALEASMKLNELAPADIEGQGLTLYLMSPYCLNKPAEEILARAKKNLDAHPGDPRYVLLQGYAYHCVADDQTAAKLYQEAAANPPADPEFVKMCTNQMDAVRLFDKSQDLLERAAADGKDPRMVRMLIQRLWQNGRYPQVVERLKDIGPDSPNADAHLLAYKAYALYELRRENEASPIVSALAGRKDDDVALAWAKALTARFEMPNANARDQVQQYQAALVRDPSNTAARYLMGEAYSRLGETELAVQCWTQVIRDVPSWPTPRVQMAYLFAATGRTQLAVEQAAQAYAASQNLGSAIGLVVALATQLDSGGAEQPNVTKVLELAGEIQQKVPGEPQTLPIYVSLLARTGEKDKAVAAVNDAMSKGYPIGTDAWLRLASVSRQQKLGLEAQILRHAQGKDGATPKIALANAVMASEAGKPGDGLKVLIDAAAKAPAEQAAQWQLVIAQYREHIKDPNARDAWVQLGDKYTSDLAVQSTITDLPETSSAWQDRPFIERTIQRLKALTGDQGYHWQLARGRWLLASPNRDRDSAQAAAVLGDIVRNSPNLVAPRIYFARALENSNSPAAAIEQLRAAAERNPDNVAVALDLVRLYQADGKFSDAKVYLDRAAKSATDPRGRQRLARFYSQQGDLDAALKVLGTAVDNPDADLDSQVLAADLYRRRGEFDAATKLFQRIAQRPDVDESALAEAADYFAAHDRMDKARATLDRLSQLKLPAGHREAILAGFTERHGQKDAAEGLFRQAVEAAPTDPAIWRQLVTFQLRQDRFDQAAITCDQALAKIPGNEDLQSLRSQALALKTNGPGGGVNTDALIAELSKDPRNDAARESLATYNDIKKNNEPPDSAVQKMRRVADKYPRFLPVQTQVVRMYLQLGKRDEAIAVARRAMDNFPNDADPASLATITYASGGRWADTIATAEEWRRRTLENPEQADLWIARARVEQNQPTEAMKVLERYMETAKAEPDKHNAVLGTYAHALIVDGRDADAMALLKPYLSRSEDWQVSTLRLAALIRGPLASKSRWIEEVAALVPADSLKGRYEIANAWYTAAMGLRERDPARTECLAKARDVITPLTKRADATAAVWLMAGSIAENTKDPGTAIDAYRHSLQLDGKQPLAQNNLAYLLLGQNRDLDEARQLSEKAVAAMPGETDYYDTLARVYQKSGKADRAIATYQKILDLDPQNVQAMVPTIQLLQQLGQRDAAKAMLNKLETLLQTNPALQTPDVDVQKLRQQVSRADS